MENLYVHWVSVMVIVRCGGEGGFSGVGGRMKQPWILVLFVKILEGVLQTAH